MTSRTENAICDIEKRSRRRCVSREALMVRDSLTIKAPYGRSAAENQWMTQWLRNRFTVLFGRDFPDLHFVP